MKKPSDRSGLAPMLAQAADVSYPRAIVRLSAASIFAPLRENGRAANILSANSSLVRSLPSDFTHRSKACSSPLVYSVMDARTGTGAFTGIRPLGALVGAFGLGSAGTANVCSDLTGLGRSLAATAF